VGVEGVIAIDTSVAGVTVTANVDEVFPFTETVICTAPAPTPVATPVELIVATAGFELAKVAELLKSRVLPSEYVPVTVNCCVVPLAKLAVCGESVTETSVADVTCTVVEMV
jgi:hypothetical protein